MEPRPWLRLAVMIGCLLFWLSHRNLAYTATEEELAEAFGRFGPLVECHLCLDKELRRSKGFAYVTFANPQDAAEAVRCVKSRHVLADGVMTM